MILLSIQMEASELIGTRSRIRNSCGVNIEGGMCFAMEK